MHNKSRARIYRSQGMPIVPLGHRGLLIVPVDISAASVRIAKVFSAFSVASTHTYDHVLPSHGIDLFENPKNLSPISSFSRIIFSPSNQLRSQFASRKRTLLLLHVSYMYRYSLSKNTLSSVIIFENLLAS